MSIFSHHSKRSSRGFTLIELVVVMAIMVVITIVFLVRQSRFDSSTVLRSLAYSVALSVRQAQVYGTSVEGTTTSSTNCTGGFYSATNGTCYAAAYGLYFTAASPTSYVLFADLNNDGQYESNEFIKNFNLGTGYTIADLCVKEIGTSNTDCWVNGTTPGLLGANASLTILFQRPNPDACIASNLQASACQSGQAAFYNGAYIELQANADSTNEKRVDVLTTGEVDVCTGTNC